MEPYDKDSLIRQLQELELTLAHSWILPLIPPFGAELANNLSLEPLDIQFLLEFQTKWPLTYFEKTDEGIKVAEEPSSSTFIFFGGQSETFCYSGAHKVLIHFDMVCRREL